MEDFLKKNLGGLLLFAGGLTLLGALVKGWSSGLLRPGLGLCKAVDAGIISGLTISAARQMTK